VADAAASTAALVDGFTPNTEDPDGLEAQVAALLGAAGSLSAHAMAEADEALAPKVGSTGYFKISQGAITSEASCWPSGPRTV
jgi:hypothetical protein